MKVGVYYNNKDIRVEEKPIPKISEGEILMKTRACGICGTDLLEWYRIKKAPLILGHEATGEIIESRSENYKVGQRIFASHHIPCNKCHYCLNGHHTSCETLHQTNYDPGGFSEYIRLSRMNVEFGIYSLPDGISYDVGSLIEPLACVIRAQNLAKIWERQTLLVIGCGVSGLLNVTLGKIRGLYTIGVDLNEYRLKKAEEFGADLVFKGNKEKILADCVILCSGNPEAIDMAFSSIDKGGVIVFFAVPSPSLQIPFPISNLWRQEITMVTSYGAGPRDLQEALRLIKKIDAESMITHRFPLEKIQEGFSVVEEQKESMKVVIVL
ncbi:MAG: alcohol dehydrogenase catalytic domain-containing protein [bacterium]